MDALRRYVFPLIWMLILAVIALSLARMAFFPADASGAAEDPDVPAAEFDQYAVVPVETSDIASELTLPATVQPDEGTELKATDEGEINKIWAREGDTVEKGQRILQVRVPEEPAPVDIPPEMPAEGTTDGATAGDGTDEGGAGAEPVEQPAPQPEETEQQYRYLTLYANAPGKITGLTLAEWESVATGDVVATISPGTYSIVAELTPEQQLSLLDVDIDASAILPTATDPVHCKAPGITEDAEVAKPEAPQIDPMTGEETTSSVSAAQLECAVPAGTKIVPGLSVEVTVKLGSATGVLTVPTTAAEGTGETGTVYMLDEGTGEPTPVEVTLGLRGDGVVEITEGLEEGQEILQFVPGVDNPDDGMGGGEMW
ncbi:efflux RND transporter periplasmic adaptor subunit [Brachybacterium tyrofermentans]|uniref:efflux RND transporter periplasmic adaptor subunit n=1 Tax=Brachybacterium tyrofermentans TaxID=47848 RepID=UPI000A1A4C96|nr:Membrane-fusion protein [Corynebacterium xerosis]